MNVQELKKKTKILLEGKKQEPGQFQKVSSFQKEKKGVLKHYSDLQWFIFTLINIKGSPQPMCKIYKRSEWTETWTSTKTSLHA